MEYAIEKNINIFLVKFQKTDDKSFKMLYNKNNNTHF